MLKNVNITENRLSKPRNPSSEMIFRNLHEFKSPQRTKMKFFKKSAHSVKGQIYICISYSIPLMESFNS